MPISPQEMDWMRQFAAGAPPADLRAQIPAMYNEPTPDQIAALGSPGPDARTAQNMSTEPAMSVDPGLQSAPAPAPAPVSSDAGGMSGGGPAMSVAPAPAMSTVTPEQQAQMGREAEARLAATSAPPEEPGAAGAVQASQTPYEATVQRALIDKMRGSPGRVQPGGEQLAGRTVERELHGRASPETSEELDYAQRGAEGLAVEGGEKSAAGLEAMAANQRKQAQDARTELSAYTRQNAAKQAEYDIRQSDLDDMREDIKKNPASYWSGNVGNDVVNAIGLAILFGLGGPNMVMHQLDRDFEQKQKERGTQLNLLQDRLNRFQQGIPHPEAQAAFHRSLGLDAAAAEAESMSLTAKSDDVRQRGFEIASSLRQKALEARAAGETGLVGKEKIETKNMPAKAVGGRPGGIEAAMKLAKEWNIPVEQAVTMMATGKAPPSAAGPKTGEEITKAKHERELFVRLPDGSGAYATTGAQKKELQDTFNTSNELLSAYDHLKKIHKQVGPSAQWNREALGDAEATVARIQELLREKGVKLNESTMKILQPLSGAGIKDWVIGPGLDAAIDRAKSIREAQTQQAREQLSSSPWEDRPITQPIGGAGSTFKAEE